MNPAQQILVDMEELYKATMQLYENYFRMLEAAIEQTPETEEEKLVQLNALAEEANTALEADMATFDKALAMDAESLTSMQEQLKIEDIYKKLQK